MTRYPRPEEFLFHRGRFFTAEWYYTEAGDIPGKIYYDDMNDLEQDRLDDLIRYLADSPYGTHLPTTMYRVEDREDKIYAFKPGGERFFNFTTEGKKIILTNAYRKHSQKMTKQGLEALEIAIRYKKDYVRRLKEGTYYERA